MMSEFKTIVFGKNKTKQSLTNHMNFLSVTFPKMYVAFD